MDDVTHCPDCGEDLVSTLRNDLDQTETPPSEDHGTLDFTIKTISPKKRNTVILLAYFLGFFGVHRFYLGKITSGIFMLLTFGGLTIWYCIDFVNAINGNYTDSKGRSVDAGYNRNMVMLLFIIPVVFLIIAAVVLFIFAYIWFQDGFSFESPSSL
ncbi:MAG: TM2 domain-containing protein [Deltaproteobacteria bacterium]|jgi:hypothetical protein|nr:TM2 domain-containing protein [Deltaproteobacteria bacterium]